MNTQTKLKCLNLGSGRRYIQSTENEEWINLEVDKSEKAEIYHNLNKLPLPFQDNTFDYVIFSHVIEHLSSDVILMDLFNEISRIMKKDAILQFDCPHYSSWTAFDMYHTRAFNFRNFISLPQFKVIKAGLYNTLNYPFGTREKKFGMKTFNRVIEYLANLNPLVCERFWCFWVGGFVEQRFILQNIKGKAGSYYVEQRDKSMDYKALATDDMRKGEGYFIMRGIKDG